jgi:HEAT repeat protein
MIHFCPRCWNEIRPGAVCPACGPDRNEPAAEAYDEKLIRALRHPVPSVPIRAAALLGERGTKSAAAPLIEIASSSRDPYLQEAAIDALGKIGDEQAVDCLAVLARQGALRVRHAARAALRCLRSKRRPGDAGW